MLKAAKLAEVPRDIIERNLKKASDKQQADFFEVCRLVRVAQSLRSTCTARLAHASLSAANTGSAGAALTGCADDI